AEAFTADDIDTLVALLTDDAWLTMPPAPHEYHGVAAVASFLRASAAWRAGVPLRLQATRANGQPAFGCYLGTTVGRPAGLIVLTLAADRVHGISRFLDSDFRRNRNLTVGMAVVPVLFCVQPLVAVFTLDPAASTALGHEHVLLYMLGIPALVPSFVAAYSVVGERQQGTLEPVLTTPIRHEELLLGKALATLLPSLAVAYVVYGLFLACVELFAAPAVASALIRLPDLLAQLCFTPLLAGWSIWI